MPENSAQTDYLNPWFDAGFLDIVRLTRTISVFDLIFIGLFVLPLGLGAVPRLSRLIRSTPKRAWLAFGLSVMAVGIAAVSFDATFERLRLPFVFGSLTAVGLGPAGDLRGGRVALMGTRAMTLATIACVIAALVVLLAVCARLFRPRSSADSAAWVVLSVLVW